MVMRNLVLVFASIEILMAAPVYGACTKPDAPSCATQRSAFTDVDDFDQCRLQMLSYRDGMEAFASCLQQDGQSSQEKSARDELQDILSRFNRRARGE
jgi:hypothetical protein